MSEERISDRHSRLTPSKSVSKHVLMCPTPNARGLSGLIPEMPTVRGPVGCGNGTESRRFLLRWAHGAVPMCKSKDVSLLVMFLVSGMEPVW